jgi:excinuclease ABC subunit C
MEKQSIDSSDDGDADVIAFARAHDEALVQVFFVRGGKMVGREHFMLNHVDQVSRAEVMTEFIKQFYAEAAFIPKELILDTDIVDREVVIKWLTALKGRNVAITVPVKGEKHDLVEMASKNALLTFEQFGEHIKREKAKTEGALAEIQMALGLESPLERIEAYDISNIQGFESVGSMVVFEHGKPKNSDYRKFRIKTVIGPDDYASMEEVIGRRFTRYKEESANRDIANAKFIKLPDIIFMDGGKGQVHAAEGVLERMGIRLPVAGMIKDDRHRTRGLVFRDIEVELPHASEGFKLVTRIQDEVHRFAIEYHRKLRANTQVHSLLDDIEGIGPTRRKELMKHFRSIDNIRSAELEELEQVEGMNKRASEAVYRYFRRDTAHIPQ